MTSRSTRSRFNRLWLLAGLLAACASTPQVGDGDYDVLHEGLGVRADLDGWQVFQDPASAPVAIRPAFGGKQGPDDPPLFVATRDDVIFTTAVVLQPIDALTVLHGMVDALGERGEVRSAARLPNGDIHVTSRIAVGGLSVYSHQVLHTKSGRLVNLSFASQGQLPPADHFFEAIRGVELLEAGVWHARWELDPAVGSEPIPGFDVEPDRVAENPFEEVDCAANDRPLLWRAHGSAGSVYLFGSIHVGHPSLYPFAGPIEAAFEGAARLVVELDATDPAAEQLMLERGMLPPGETLADVISSETYARLETVASELGLPVQTFDGMKPGTAALLLGTLPYLSRGFDPADGVDIYFIERAGEKRLVELETMEEQLALIEELGEGFLHGILDGLDTVDEDLDLLYRGWRCGDPAKLHEAVFELPVERAETEEERAFFAEFADVFLFERNERMARKIRALLDEPGDSFVVVGAAHLVGDRGIPGLLRSTGHRVELVLD